MDWRKTILGHSARASPEVGGRYHVDRLVGGWIVHHAARDLDGQWCIRQVEDSRSTLEEAKAAAETDNQARAQERHHQSRPRR